MVLPVIGETLVELSILLVADVIRVTGPQGFGLVQLLLVDVLLLDLLLLLLLVTRFVLVLLLIRADILDLRLVVLLFVIFILFLLVLLFLLCLVVAHLLVPLFLHLNEDTCCSFLSLQHHLVGSL